ncbi:MAG: glycosyltransferase family 2 protein [Chloroflexia bacterium]
MQPLISIVIPNMNGMEHLPDCFASLAAADYPLDRQEWIVSDNGSVDGSVGFLRREYARAKIVENGRNIGFAPGCNAGAAAATGEYLVFLNNDTRVAPGWLHGYLSALARDPEAVCAASYMRSWDDTEPDFDGAASNLFGVGRQRAVIGWPDCPTGPGEGDPLLFASGGAMLIRRDVFREVGGFDTSFFIYFEDVDLGWRLWVLGYRVVFAPGAVVYHKEGGTSGAKRAPSHRRYRLFETNTLAAIVKNYEQANLDRILPAALLLEFKRALMSGGDAINRAEYRLDGPSKAEPSPTAHLPTMSAAHILGMGKLADRWQHLMAERTRIQSRRRRPDSEILPLFRRPFAPQFAGRAYADAMRRLSAALDLYPIVAGASPSRILILRSPDSLDYARAAALNRLLGAEFLTMQGPADPVVAANADLLLSVGATLPPTGFAPNVPLAVDMGGTPPERVSAAGRAALVQRAGLVVCSDSATAVAWQRALPVDLPVAVQGDGDGLAAEVRRYCWYPLHRGRV